MSLVERIRGWFRRQPDPDHPLTEEERDGVPHTTADEASSLIDEFTGPPFDPDEGNRG